MQMKKDVQRTFPSSILFREKAVQDCVLRILYIWSIRHPASGYVQVVKLVLISLSLFSLFLSVSLCVCVCVCVCRIFCVLLELPVCSLSFSCSICLIPSLYLSVPPLGLAHLLPQHTRTHTIIQLTLLVHNTHLSFMLTHSPVYMHSTFSTPYGWIYSIYWLVQKNNNVSWHPLPLTAVPRDSMISLCRC